MKQLQLSLLRSSWLIRSALMLLFWMLLQQPNGCFACVEEERIALLDIKSAFDVRPYSIFKSWNINSTECCSWDGVSCSPNTKHVKRLDLDFTVWSSYNNHNTLNVSLFLPFRDLRSLILSYNNFNSCIPSDCFGRLAELDSLQYLDLAGNHFDSKALSSLAALGSLKALSLSRSGETTEFFSNGSLNVHKQSPMTSQLFINAFEDLAKLSSLKYLDLSDNRLNGSIIPYLGGISSLKTLNLEGNNINEGLDLNALEDLAKLRSLKYLDLSSNWLNGSIIPYLGGISSLKTLNLEWNNMDEGFDLNASRALSKLSKLNYLDLSSNQLNESIVPYLVGLSSLKTLILAGNNMGGALPLKAFEDLAKLRSLKYLDLSDNSLNGSIIPYLGGISSLKILNFQWNNIDEGLDLNGLCKIKNLEVLDISYNNMKGDIPLCFGHLSSLKHIDISSNQLGRLFPSSVIENLTMLDYASFSDNNFEDTLTMGIFFNKSKLKVLDLSNNYQLQVRTEDLGTVQPSFQLTEISLSNCILNSFVPTFLSNQYMIEKIDLSGTSLKGNIPLWLFKNKTSLNHLNLRNNSLNGPLIFPSHITNLTSFDVSNNKFTGEMPTNIGYVLPKVEFLDLSHNFLQGAIPSSFGNLSQLTILDLSINKLSGQISNFIEHFSNLGVLDLSENEFQGNLFPNNSSLHQLSIYFADNNQFIGEVPSNLCMNFHLEALDISMNQLSGILPSCFRNFSFLWLFNARENYLQGNLTSEFCHLSRLAYVDLSKNNLSGLVPSCINMSSLEYLNLNGNSLTGPFPNALLNNPLALKTLDLGNNHFSGNIPTKMWTSLKNLKIISLKGNHFEGALSRQICKLKYLRVLDLSQNKLRGRIPSCLHNAGSNGSLQLQVEFDFRYGVNANNLEIFEKEYIEFQTKRRSDSYKGKIINQLSGLDLSGNQFDGKIPEEIGEMTWLRDLNLSNNRLTGPIPATLSRLRDIIESLDLSHNMLVGHIPSQLAELHFLAFFSVAYNNLSGPTLGMVSQFSTFDESSYEGNPYLCGPPLTKSCNATVLSPQQHQVPSDHDDDDEAMDRILVFASVVLGFITGFWGWMALLYFKRNWLYSLFLATDEYMNKAIDMARNLLMKMKSFW